MKYLKLFEDFHKINEGCWSLPYTQQKAQDLKDMVDSLQKDPNYVFGTRDHIGPGHGTISDDNKPDLYDLLGCDGLFDTITELTGKKDQKVDNQKIADAIIDNVKWFVDDYTKDPSGYKDKFEDEALTILKTIQ